MDTNKTFDSGEVRKNLREGVCQLTFVKADGSKRVMNATLNELIVPATETDPTKKPRAENHEVQRVYDVDISEWRSFRWDSLESVNLSTGTQGSGQ